MHARYSRVSGKLYNAKNRMKNWQNSAPITLIDRPHTSIFLNRARASSPEGIAAMHRAPIVESGETSTTAAPTLMLMATCSGSPPPSFATTPGTAGRNAGYTTPEVELYVEMRPV